MSTPPFDRAGYDKLSKRFKQQHKMLEAEYKGGGSCGPTELKLKNWDVSTACAAHDAMNGLKWGVKAHRSPSQLKDLWVVST